MKISDLTAPEVQLWIEANLNANIRALGLQKSPFKDIPMKDLVIQIQGRKIARKKFPDLDRPGIVLPPKLNLEQTSSQITAEYKSTVIHGSVIADITGGFGIDALHFARYFNRVFHIEHNNELQQIAQHNFRQLGLENISSHHADGIEFLKKTDQLFDVIFIDPSRRGENGKRFFLLHELQPDITRFMDFFMSKSHTVLIKLSPLMDLTRLTQIFDNIENIHVVAVKNEVKEVLIKLSKSVTDPVEIIALNLGTEQSEFRYSADYHVPSLIFSEPEEYIYEPNNAVLKSGGVDNLAESLGLAKLHPNTQLFTSNILLKNFPGRIFRLKETVKNPNKALRNRSIQAIYRNYPQSLNTLKKRYSFSTDGIEPVLFTQSLKKVYLNFLKEIKL